MIANVVKPQRTEIFESWIDEVRIRDYEENKGKPQAQVIKEKNARGMALAKQYGITVVKTV